MRDMGLEAKDGDIIFPITPVGRLPPTIMNSQLRTAREQRKQ